MSPFAIIWSSAAIWVRRGPFGGLRPSVCKDVGVAQVGKASGASRARCGGVGDHVVVGHSDAPSGAPELAPASVYNMTGDTAGSTQSRASPSSVLQSPRKHGHERFSPPGADQLDSCEQVRVAGHAMTEVLNYDWQQQVPTRSVAAEQRTWRRPYALRPSRVYCAFVGWGLVGD